MGVVGTWVVKIIGAMIWIGFGLGVWKIWSISKEEKDYSQYPTTMGYVRFTQSFHDDGYRQFVEFTDQNGKKVMGMHDRCNCNGFPEHHTTQKIYYWKLREGLHYSINGEPIEYYIHYCDQRFYKKYDEESKSWHYLLPVIGTLLIALGVYALFSK